jgi:mannose-1-phosphate guanylyltransferase / mannose-6-phosphate isomerase
MRIQPVVLCGGSGTRLWPLSREQHPKQLLAFNGNDSSLLQETVRRLNGLAIEPAPPVIVCNEDHRFMVADQLRAAAMPAGSILLEPAGRGTAPALTLAVLHTVTDREALLLVMPSDHVITRNDAFHEAVLRGAALAAEGCLVTFGVPPLSPETGYGYIRTGEALSPDRSPAAYGVTSFVEKPDAQTAQRYVAAGSYLWNSGIFMVRGPVWLDALRRLRPELLAACERAYARGANDGDFYRPDARAFADCPADSIDYAVMERIGSQRAAHGGPIAVAVKLEAGWSDVGAWDALWKLGTKDGDGNVLHGDVCAVDTRQALLIARHRLLACVGLDDVVVIETPDAVMVARRDRAQDVKKVVARLKSAARQECLNHRKVFRPWGSYDGVDQGDRFQVKRIVVNPGAALSLQMHYHRAEHWVVVRGTARVTRGEETFLLTENQSTYIPLGVKHRLANPGRVPLEIIEVQSGAYLGEDDIVRYEDSYGRTEPHNGGGTELRTEAEAGEDAGLSGIAEQPSPRPAAEAVAGQDAAGAAVADGA